MLSESAVRYPSDWSRSSATNRRGSRCHRAFKGFVGLLLAGVTTANAVTLWSDPGATLIYDTGVGRDILEGAVKRDDTSNDTLYFKFHLDPLSDATTEEYFAGFELYEGDTGRLGVGNALKAWAYSAFFKLEESDESSQSVDYLDLHASSLETSASGVTPNYELPRRGTERTIVFKVQYVVSGDDLVTVWLNPDLSSGATEVHQSETLTTRFNADVSFDELRLRHGGAGGGWIFSELGIATSFSDFVDTSSAKPAVAMPDASANPVTLNFQSWQREAGMPRSTIRALAQSREGYLWLGSEDGLTRFDGVRYVPVDLRLETPDCGVRTLLGDSNGALWIGTTNCGLIRYQEGELARFSIHEGLPSEEVTALAEDSAGQLWVGTTAGLVVWQKGRFECLSGLEELGDSPIMALFKDHSGVMWIAAQSVGIFQFQQGKLSSVTEPMLEPLLRAAHCLLVDRSGRIWIGAGDDFVLCWESGLWRRYRIPRHSATPYITSLVEDPDGTVWAGSVSEGLFQFKQGKIVGLNAGTGLPDNRVTTLFVDRDGKLWVGSGSGLNQLRRKHLFALGQGDGLGYGATHGLAEVARGVVWAVKPNDGLYRWEGSVFNRLMAAGFSARDSKASVLMVARDGSCWVACTNGLLFYRDPQAVADQSRLFELTNASICALAEDSEGRIWAGSREGELWRLVRGRWSKISPFALRSAVTALVPEADGSVWVGTHGDGLFHCDNTVRTHFGKTNGLRSDAIRTLHRDATGTLWIGTDGGGLGRWQKGRLTSFTTREGLPDDTISQILEDDAERLWLGGNRGLVCVSKRDFAAVADHKATTLYTRIYGRADGMPSEECTTSFFPSGLRTRSGLLWFSTLKGIVVADPRHRSTNTTPPTVILEEVLVDGAPLREFYPSLSTGQTSSATPKALRITPGKHQLELHYTGLDFEAPEQMRFRYQLEGLDPDWVEAGPRRTAFYNYVPPGEYRFRVMAANANGIWSEAGTGVRLTVARYFWQQWWVVVLGALGLLVAVGASVRIVEKRKSQRRLKRLEQERALERERTRIAQDLHDEMGAKLCRISFLSEHARRSDRADGEVRQQITNIADASRELLHSLDEIVWAVNPHNDTLEHVASYINQYAQNYFHSTGIECELDMPDQFPPHPVSSQARHHLFLAVHEAFTNILKHSGATRTRVAMSCNTARFELYVADNGKGFNLTDQQTALQNGGGSEDGLRNMRQRLESVGGQCRLESIPGRGTQVWFDLPLKNSNKEKVKI